MHENIRYHDALIADALQKVSDTVAPAWSEVDKALAAFDSSDESTVAEKLEALRRVITEGQDKDKAHRKAKAELRELTQERARLAAVEWKRMADLGALVPFDMFATLLRTFMVKVRDVTLDESLGPKGKLRVLHEEVMRLLPAR